MGNCGVSEIRGTLLGSILQGDPTIGGSILGAPYFRKTPTGLQVDCGQVTAVRRSQQVNSASRLSPRRFNLQCGLQGFKKMEGSRKAHERPILTRHVRFEATFIFLVPTLVWSRGRRSAPAKDSSIGPMTSNDPGHGVCNLESGAAGTPDFFWKSGVWSLGPRVLQIFSGNLESGVWGPGYSRFFLEIWSLESGAPVLQIFSGNLESGVRGPRYSRFFLEIWSLESGAPVLQIFSGNLESGVRAPVLQIFSGNLESGVRGPGTPDFFWKSGVRGPGTPDFFWKSGVRGPDTPDFFLEI